MTPFQAGEQGRQTQEGEWGQERELGREGASEAREGLELEARPAEAGQPEEGEVGWVRGRGRLRLREMWWWRRWGWEAGNSPAAPQVEVVERGGTEGAGASERARRTRRERGVQTEAQEWPVLEVSQAGGHLD